MVAFFFFQAEDGIRDLVRSRGLGDVYKRQGGHGAPAQYADPVRRGDPQHRWTLDAVHDYAGEPVSYTHLTLPTSDLV